MLLVLVLAVGLVHLPEGLPWLPWPPLPVRLLGPGHLFSLPVFLREREQECAHALHYKRCIYLKSQSESLPNHVHAWDVRRETRLHRLLARIHGH